MGNINYYNNYYEMESNLKCENIDSRHTFGIAFDNFASFDLYDDDNFYDGYNDLYIPQPVNNSREKLLKDTFRGISSRYKNNTRLRVFVGTSKKFLTNGIKYGIYLLIIYLVWIVLNMLYYLAKKKAITDKYERENMASNDDNEGIAIREIDEDEFENPIVKMSFEELEKFCDTQLNCIISGKWNRFDKEFAAPYIKKCQQRLEEKPDLDVHIKGTYTYTESKKSRTTSIGMSPNHYIRISEVEYFPNLDDILKYALPDFRKYHATFKRSQIDHKIDAFINPEDPTTFEIAKNLAQISRKSLK